MSNFPFLKKWWWTLLLAALLIAILFLAWEAQQKVNHLEKELKGTSPQLRLSKILSGWLLKILLFHGLSFTVMLPVKGQSITINPRSRLLMNGPVHLVVKNAALVNDGILDAGAGTIKFTGDQDTAHSYFGGSVKTAVYNLSIDKTISGTSLKTPVTVKNVLGVYSGTLFTDSNLILHSDSNRTARVDKIPAGASIKGKAIVERYFPGHRAWRLVTAPLTNTPSIFDTWQNKGVYENGINTLVSGPGASGAAGNGLDISPMNNSSMKTWNFTTQLLEPVLNTKVPLSNGNTGSADNTGYFLFVRGDRNPVNFTIPNTNNTTLKSNGSLQTGTQTFSVSPVAGAYSLIGNPYASPVNFNDVARTNLIKRFYVWDPSINALGAYIMLDDLDNDGIFTKTIVASTQDNHIQSSQAFFVQTLNNGPALISFSESCKSAGNNNKVFRPLSPGNLETIRVTLNKVETDSSTLLADGLLLECSEIFSDSVNSDDAVKFSNVDETIGLVRYGKNLAAERRPLLTDKDTLFLKLTHTSQRQYELDITPFNIQNPVLTAWLADAYLKTQIALNLTTNNKYLFSIDNNAASANATRFSIFFKLANVLPVHFISVDAHLQNTDALIKWRVENETDISSYTVERSANGNDFDSVGRQAASALNAVFKDYQFTDSDPLKGTNYYRIKSLDKTGKLIYSGIVKVLFDLMQKGIDVYPNPVTNNSIQIHFNHQPTGKYQLNLLNAAGQLIYQYTWHKAENINSYVIQPSTDLPAANYQLQVTAPTGIVTTKQITVANNK